MTNKKAKKPLPKPVGNLSKDVVQAPIEHKKNFSANGKLALLLGIISFLVYANTLENGFVLDDSNVITNNTIVTKGISAIPEILTTPYRRGFWISPNDTYRPLSLVMFAAEYQFFGKNPMPGHFINILLYASCVVLLFLFFDQFFEQKKTAIAFIAALLFSLHPIHTEVVANIKSRDELLSFFFAFLCLNVLIKYMNSGKVIQLLMGSFCFLLALLSKETVISFYAVILLVFIFYQNESKKRTAYIIAGTLLMVLIYLAARFSVLNYYHANEFSAVSFMDNALTKTGLPITSRLATAILILGYYLKMLFIPFPLICDYSYKSFPFVNFTDPWVIISLAVYVSLFVFCVRRLLQRRKDFFVFGILFCFITLALYANVFMLIAATFGERFLFFPSVGFCLVIALLIEKWVRAGATSLAVLKNPRVLGIVIPVSVIYIMLTFNRNAEWKDTYTLYASDITKAPNDSHLNYLLGLELLKVVAPAENDAARQKQLSDEGLNYLKTAEKIYADYAVLQSDLGHAYLSVMQYDSAEVHLNRAIQLDPENATSINNLAGLYVEQKKYAEAIEILKRSIEFNTNNITVYFNIGYCFLSSGKSDSAIYYLEKAAASGPDLNNSITYDDIQVKIADAYWSKLQLDSAEAHENYAIRLNPKNTIAINKLGGIYFQREKYEEAIGIYKKSIEIRPNGIDPYSNIGACYFKLKKFDSTVYYLKKAVMINPGFTKSYGDLALTYNAMGQPDSARKYAAIAQAKFKN